MRIQGSIKCLGVVACMSAMLTVNAAAASQSPSPPQPQPSTPRATPAQPDTSKGAGAQKSGAAADAQFVRQAAEGGMMEVAKGKLATQKGSHEGVKQFGQRMVDDHTKANDELKSIASGKNITLPGDTPKPPMQAAMAKLEKLDGAAFDRAYVDDQVRDHEKTIALFEREAKSGKDAELKAFAEKTLPTLKEHLTAVRDLKSKVAKGGTN
jgi:putative membrane protein